MKGLSKYMHDIDHIKDCVSDRLAWESWDGTSYKVVDTDYFTECWAILHSIFAYISQWADILKGNLNKMEGQNLEEDSFVCSY